jgi:CheY-like chemotaxis protein
MLPRIFSMFEQADFRSGRGRGGIGIGLALVKQLTLLHGGTISAHSDGLGKGSQFTILLPAIELPASASVPAQTEKPASPPAVEASAAPSAPAQIQQPPLPVTAEHCHVLVVDDNVDAANTMAWMLELMGCDVKTANDGQAALEAAQSFGPEVILLDIGLPGMDGYKVCEAMRRVPSLKNTTIIAQTGYGQHKDRQLSHEAGFDDHLVKPVSMEALQKVLDSRPVGNSTS